MPNGNIGTSLTTFLSLIRTCRLPPHVIRKLGLSFPNSRSKHCYGNVRFDYGNDVNKGSISLCPENKRNLDKGDESEEITSKRASNNCNFSGSKELGTVPDNGRSSNRCNANKSVSNIASNCQEDADQHNICDVTSDNKQNTNKPNIDTDDDEMSSDAESEPEEDWERHEALHDNVDCQGRTKERLYENEIELKWEKGGSGLVFYTDAAYWESLSGDFDEQTADDWDIDMSIYEKGGKYQ